VVAQHGSAGLACPKLARLGLAKVAASTLLLGSARMVAGSGSGSSRKLAGAAATLPPEEHSSERLWRHLADRFWHPPDTSRRSPTPPGSPQKKMRMSPHHHIPSQAVTRPVSPSQPDSASRRLRTSLTSYATPIPSPAQTPGTSTSQSPVDNPLDELQFYPYEPEGNNPESGSETNPESIDFINAMHTSDEPDIPQPEDVALLLYLGHTPF